MSDFEEFARSQGFSGDFQRGCNGQYKSDLLHFMEKAFMHQQAEIDRLSSVLDERTKEWLQAIECGTYFENVAKPLKEENDRLKAQLNNMEACYIEKKKELEDQHKKVDEVLEYLDGESANRWGLWKEKADMLDQGASNAFEEAYWMVKKVLRGKS